MQVYPMSHYKSFPVVEVNVNDWYKDTYLEGCDLQAVETYKQQLSQGRYEPIVVGDECGAIDGCHRLIAAHQLGLLKINAHYITS